MPINEGESRPNEVFLSHSSHDRPFAGVLANVLRQHEVPVWYSDTSIKGAQQWHDEIGYALRRCDWLILVLSPHSVQSTWVKRELVYALEHERFENHIVPVRYEPCDHEELSWTLSQIQMVDFQKDVNLGYRELLSI